MAGSYPIHQHYKDFSVQRLTIFCSTFQFVKILLSSCLIYIYIFRTAVPRTPRREFAFEENVNYINSGSEILKEMTKEFTKFIIFIISIKQYQNIYDNAIKELNGFVPEFVNWEMHCNKKMQNWKIECLSHMLKLNLQKICHNRNITFDVNKWFNELLKNAQMFSSIFTKMMLFFSLQTLMCFHKDYYNSVPYLKIIYNNVQRTLSKFEELKRPISKENFYLQTNFLPSNICNKFKCYLEIVASHINFLVSTF